MLLLGHSFENMPILSLRSGNIVGTVVGHLINPHKLTVDALWCKIGGFKNPRLLIIQDIREITIRGAVIDDVDVIIDPADAIRLQKIIELAYELIDKKVISARLPIGRLQDYAIDRDSFIIRKIYVEPALWNRLKTTRLTIDRSQIVEVSNKYVRVKGTYLQDDQKVGRRIQSTLPVASSASTALIEE